VGEADVLMAPGLVDKLRRAPFADAIAILSATPFDDDLLQVRVRSPLLAGGYHGQQEIVVYDHKVRFKKEVDV
jgi:hypothetical protein